MNEDIKTCIYSGNTDADYCLALRTSLTSHPAIRVLSEAHDQQSLIDSLDRLPVGLLVFDLDPKPSISLDIMEDACARFPSLAIIALSEKSDPGLILSAMRAGCRQFITKPIEQNDLARALKPLTRAASGNAKTERLICLLGSSGGCGVTTICANLAIELAQLANEACALVDLQLEFGSIATFFDLHPSHTIADLTNTSNEIDARITEQAMTILPSQVAILARPGHVEQASQIKPERVAQILQVLTKKHDAVVVDTPSRFDGVSIAALEMANVVLLALELTVPSIRNTQRLYTSLIKYGMPPEKIHLVVNRFTPNSPISPHDVEEQLGTSVFAVIPNDYQTVQAALDFGRPLLSDSPDSPVRQAIAQMAGRIYRGDFSAAESKSKRKAGILSRWLGSGNKS